VIGRLDRSCLRLMPGRWLRSEGAQCCAKALAGEIEARATKISQASNDQIVLADGTLRWTGDLVGKLWHSDDTLRPRIRVIADEHHWSSA
jgi:hypothetical protein